MEKNRNTRKGIADETLKIIENGYYQIKDNSVSIQQAVDYCINNTELIKPNDEITPSDAEYETTFTLKNETTLEGCITFKNDNVFCLNFASAKNPGGGFLGGAQAQEESLARSSALYPSLTAKSEMYESNRMQKSCIYLDYMIYSPDTPVFRDDRGTLLEVPYKVSFITAPAVNAGVVKRAEPGNIEKIRPAMARRIDRVLSFASVKNHETLVLGAWGCGVFQNDPEEIAQLFNEAFTSKFKGKFKRVHFAVLDTKDRGIFRAFEQKLKPLLQ